MTLLLEDAIGGVARPMLALSAGAFVYIAGADLIPELHRSADVRGSVLQFLGVAAGFVVMAALLVLE
jgi:zinc transporter ZupT